MTRRGTRSRLAISRWYRARVRTFGPALNAATGGLRRWEDRHGEMATFLNAYCVDCGLARRGVSTERCNVRHPDGRQIVEAIMLAVASYGRCTRCGCPDVKILSVGEVDVGHGLMSAGKY